MRVVFLANRTYDFLQDAVYHGLATLLGAENVLDYPRLDRYHGATAADARYPQLHFDFPDPERPPFLKAVAAVDAVVIGSPRADVRPFLDELLSLGEAPPLALVDGEDDCFVRRIENSVDVYCKRETILDGRALAVRWRARRAFRRITKRAPRDPLTQFIRPARAGDRRLTPLPLAWIGPLHERLPIEHDVAFLNAPTSPQRVAVRAELERLAAAGVRVRLLGDGERLTWHEYMDALAGSRIGVSVRGGGFDTFRYWEIPAAGALLLAETPATVIPDNFADGREAIVAPVAELVSRIPPLLDRDTESIALAGRARLAEAHTSVQRAQRVLDALSAAGTRASAAT